MDFNLNEVSYEIDNISLDEKEIILNINNVPAGYISIKIDDNKGYIGFVRIYDDKTLFFSHEKQKNKKRELINFKGKNLSILLYFNAAKYLSKDNKILVASRHQQIEAQKNWEKMIELGFPIKECPIKYGDYFLNHLSLDLTNEEYTFETNIKI